MKNFCRLVLIACTSLISATSLAQTAAPSAPPPPVIEIPVVTNSSAKAFCIDCMPFEPKAHAEMLQKLVGNAYIGELRKALYMQDGAHQFESKAHFDNCDFDSSMAYIKTLLAEVGAKVDLAKAAAEKNDNASKEKRVKEAFFALGQALHGTQDFYAHTNYVEMHVGAAKKVKDLKVVPVWTSAGVEQVNALVKTGLKSGYVFWGFPQKCPSDSPSHGKLAKDSETTVSGKVRIAHLQNTSQFTLAQALAQRASIDLVSHAFNQWPLLKEMNGENVAFEVLLENRNLE
jgi:hypothetical protein